LTPRVLDAQPGARHRHSHHADPPGRIPRAERCGPREGADHHVRFEPAV